MTSSNDRAKKIEELPEANTIAVEDLFVIHRTAANTTSGANLSVVIQSLTVGPYANDAVAEAANVALGELYYNANGVVFVRLV